MEPLVNMQFVINEVTLKNHNIMGENFQVKPRFTRTIKKLNESNVNVELRVEILNKLADNLNCTVEDLLRPEPESV